MKITEAQIRFGTAHTAVEYHRRRESLTVWADSDDGSRRSVSVEQEQVSTRLSLSAEALAARLTETEADRRIPPPFQNGNSPIPEWANGKGPVKATVPEEARLEFRHNLEISMVKLIIEKMTGKELKLLEPGELQQENAPDLPGNRAIAKQSEAGVEREGWGMVYEYSETRYEQESTTFSAHGLVRTADGKEIEFSVDLTMSREFMSHEQISLRAGDALKDPLVINFSGTAAELTDTRFAFDIDADGELDQVAFVRPGSGFLALDRNGDGEINDGGELFGALTGDGFTELARHDDDGNGWIDENDSIYNRLRIWSRDPDGSDRLVALGQHGIGAIYLGHVATPFSLKDAQNSLQGVIRSTGIYLNENGSPGTIQQVDLVA